MPRITPVVPQDRPAILALAERSGLFDAQGVALIAERLDGHLAGNDDLWLASADDERGETGAGPRAGTVSGVLYCTPEAMTDGTWNVLMLIVGQDAHGQGHGRSLMQHVGSVLAARGARLLIVETSSADGFERARAFYPSCGFTEEARIRGFYAAGDDKIVFTKALAA